MIGGVYEDFLTQWFASARFVEKRDNPVVKPEMLFRYDGGFRIGHLQKPRRVKARQFVRIEEYRGAHP